MLQEFQNYLTRLKGYSQNTAISYTSDIRDFARFLRARNQYARWSTTTREDVDAYIIHMGQQGQKASTTNRKLSAISALYKWFARNGQKVEDPTKYESRRKLPETIPSTINLMEISKAYHQAQGAVKMMIGLLATTGIRIQEMLDLTWDNIDPESGRMVIKGKGSKERVVYTDPTILGDAAQRRQLTKQPRKLFSYTQREARYEIWRALAPYCHARQLSPHAIRHTVATHMAAHHASAIEIAQVLGHRKLETSQRYINMTQIETTRTGIVLTN